MMNIKKSYDVILTASNDIDPFPRLERVAKCLTDLGLRCLALGWDRTGEHAKIENKGGLDIVRVSFPGQYGGGLKNLPGLLYWNLRLFLFHLKFRPKIVHAYDFDTVIPALIAKKLINNHVIYDIADWYADSRRVGNARTFIKKIEQWICKKVDWIILAHEERIKQIGFIPRQWSVIYNIPDESILSSLSIKSTNKDYFAYVGVLQPDRGIDQIIKAALRLQVQVTIAGYGPLEDFCKTFASMSRYIKFLGRVSYECALKIESESTAIIGLYNPQIPNNRLAAPNKFYEALILGKPLITTKDTLVGRLVEEAGVGVVVNYGDIDGLVCAFKFFKENPEKCEEIKCRARILYETKYSYYKQKQKLEQIYKKLLRSQK